MHVQLPAKAVPEMTYTVSGGTLNPTHSLTHLSFHIVFFVDVTFLLNCMFGCNAWKGRPQNGNLCVEREFNYTHPISNLLGFGVYLGFWLLH